VKRGLRRRLIVTIVLLLIAFAGIVIRGITNAFSHLTPYGELAPALMPTAEYLERNPIYPPYFIRHPASLPNENNEICMTMMLRATHRNASAEVDWFAGKNFYIDGYLAGGDMIGTIQTMHLCVDVSNLSTGLHLASVELTTRDGVEHTYTWAFRIELTPDA
jgi:hypothetical protein